MILEKNWEWSRDKFVLFIDMEKAFDRVPKRNLWHTFAKSRYNIPPKLVRVIRNTYSQCLSRVRGKDMESDWFNIETGVRQGDVLAPLLFIIYMDDCIREVGVGELGEETLVYADDVAVVTDTVDRLQELVNIWNRGMSLKGMKINTGKGKTEFIAVSRREEEYEIRVGEQRIQQVVDYKYLGTNINESNLQEREINKRISKYNRNVSMLYPLLRDEYIPRECKVTIYNTILKPIIVYGCEAWSLTTKTESKLQAAEMRVLRFIKGVTRRNHIRNTTIRSEMKVEPLLQTVERSQAKVVRPCNENDPRSTCKEVLNMETGWTETSRKAKKTMGGRRGCCVEEERDILEGGGG